MYRRGGMPFIFLGDTRIGLTIFQSGRMEEEGNAIRLGQQSLD